MSENIVNSSNNKRIAKNTLLLYVRMLILMFIGLFTSRIVLQGLGVNDYGVYNVVGGVVAMFAILSNTLNAAIVRFISVELGNKDQTKLNAVFCSSLTTQIILIVIIFVLLESIGVWFVNFKLVIPQERLYAANWVFQFSVLTFILNMWSVPYNATIIAHEKMTAFAYVSVYEGIAKLGVAYTILYYSHDKLVLYSFLLCLVGLSVRMIYGIYCKKHFNECKFRFNIDRKLLSEMFSFAVWNFIGSSSTIIRDQGGNILINIFYGPAVNAARGLAITVNSAVMGFVGNFMTAVNPQIYKSYSSGDIEYSNKLVLESTRLSFFIILLVGAPVLTTTPFLLKLWLVDIPEHTENFVRLVILFSMCESLAGPLLTLTYATGKIKIYQIIIGSLQIFSIPLAYFLMKSGHFNPEVLYYVTIFISIICGFSRLIILRKLVSFSIRDFFICVYLKVVLVSFLDFIAIYTLCYYISQNSIDGFIVNGLLSLIITACFIYFVGLTKSDKDKFSFMVRKILKK